MIRVEGSLGEVLTLISRDAEILRADGGRGRGSAPATLR